MSTGGRLPTFGWRQWQELTTHTASHGKLGEAYAFENCILRSGPGDNAHVYTGNLYMEFTYS